MSRVAFVTGAAGDIGRAVAQQLAGDGWTLALADHPTAFANLSATKDLLLGHGATVTTFSFDVADEQAVAHAVQQCERDLGAPMALVNNAGRQGAFRSVDDYPIDDLRTIIEINVIGAFCVLKSVSQAMIRAGHAGSVVNIASMAGVSGAPNMSAYSASKAAIIGLTKSAAKDLAPHGIRVNAVSPAFIGPGQMWDRQVALQAQAGSQYYSSDAAEVQHQMIGSIPLRRLGTLGEVASVVGFLAGDQSSYVNGHNLEVSGGAA